MSWEYVLFDIPLVAVSAALGFLAGRRIRRPAAAHENQPAMPLRGPSRSSSRSES